MTRPTQEQIKTLQTAAYAIHALRQSASELMVAHNQAMNQVRASLVDAIDQYYTALPDSAPPPPDTVFLPNLPKPAYIEIASDYHEHKDILNAVEINHLPINIDTIEETFRRMEPHA